MKYIVIVTESKFDCDIKYEYSGSKLSHSKNGTWTGNLKYSIVNTSDVFDWNIRYSQNSKMEIKLRYVV